MNMLTLNSKQIGKVVFKATVGYYIGKNIALFANSIINKLVIEPSFTTLANNGNKTAKKFCDSANIAYNKTAKKFCDSANIAYNKTATENPNDIKMGFHM